MPTDKDNQKIKSAVREHYATAIKQKSSCCSTAPVSFDAEAAGRFVAMAGYTSEELKSIPDDISSFGCGNPVALAEVKEGQTVLDLGSGAGLDLILAAGKTGPSGKVIGLDMTDEMIEVCRANLAKAGIKNGEVRRGEMESRW